MGLKINSEGWYQRMLVQMKGAWEPNHLVKGSFPIAIVYGKNTLARVLTLGPDSSLGD